MSNCFSANDYSQKSSEVEKREDSRTPESSNQSMGFINRVDQNQNLY